VIEETIFYGLAVTATLLLARNTEDARMAHLLALGWAMGIVCWALGLFDAYPVLDLASMMIVCLMYRERPTTSKTVVVFAYLSMLYLHTIAGTIGYEIYARTLNALFVTQLIAAGWSGGRGLGEHLFCGGADFLLRRFRGSSTSQ
jgi:hypothetical protein